MELPPGSSAKPTTEPSGGAPAEPSEPQTSDPNEGERLRERLTRELPKPQIPRATYRLQFTEHFTFRDAERLVPYFDDLGVGACYASPILKARAGSLHGYDICDHSQLNPELGSEEDFAALARALRARELGLVVDIVPNHVGIGEACNTWWMDVLENGPSSTYARYFDISWRPVKPELENKVLLPILEDQYGNVLESGKLQLSYTDGSLQLAYYERELPIAPRTYSLVLNLALDLWNERHPQPAANSPEGAAGFPTEPTAGDEQLAELKSILTALSYLPPRTEKDPERIAERNRERQVIKRRIAALYESSAEFRDAFDHAIRTFNGSPGDPRSFDRLDTLVNAQAYRAAFWRVAAEEINYRRFFDINDMAAIRVELPEVFEATHQLILRLLAEGHITALRVDHPDGLWNPADYFHKLQCEFIVRALGRDSQTGSPPPETYNTTRVVEAWLDDVLKQRSETDSPVPALPLYVVAEKILSETEPLPHNWAVYGTTGYDYCNGLNSIFVNSSNEKAFNKIYYRFIGEQTSYAEIVYNSKRNIMRGSLSSEINSLAHQLERISEENRHYRDFTLNSITGVIREVIAALGIYRTYVDVGRRVVSERDENYVDAAVEKAKRRNPGTPALLFDFLRDTLLLRNLDSFPEENRVEVGNFVMRFQQVTSPVMAKGVEDTSFYIYNRLVSLNEVGGNPAQFGQALAAFHRHNAEHRRDWPHTMLATSTHDTKRSEDVRARLNVLSEMPQEWHKILSRWRRLNQGKKTEAHGEAAPDHNDEYLLYQTLVGAWPVNPTPEEFATYRERILGYMQKATKEAKVHTSWVSPNAGYDEAISRFVNRLLPDKPNDPFRASLAAFAERVAFFGRFNSLAQVLLKLTSPGVPDIYQGTELFDFSLVDPDNRRAVDYDLRRQLLAELKERAEQPDNRVLLARELVGDLPGRSKLYVTAETLDWRRTHAGLVTEGSYRPLEARGAKQEHVCGFARATQDQVALMITPRLIVGLLDGAEQPPLGENVWRDTRLLLPVDLADAQYRDLFTGRTLSVTRQDGMPGIPLAEILCDFPVALLERV